MSAIMRSEDGMTSCTGIDFESLYNEVLTTYSARQVRVSKATSKASEVPSYHQCEQVDELWCELSACVHKWRGYAPEFIATRFCNMHYVGAICKIGNAYPPDDVWTHVVTRIHDQLYNKLVVMRFRNDDAKVIRVWK